MKKTKEEKMKTGENAEQSLVLQRRAQKRKKTIKKATINILIIVFVIFGLYSYNFHLKNGRWPWKAAPVENPVDAMVQAQVYESTYAAEIDISGSVKAFDTQEVMIRASGAVTAVYVKEGDRVKKGQLLAEVDSTSASYNVANLEWQLEKAKVSGSFSTRELELREMELESAKRNLDNTKAYANFDGVVVSVSIKEGDYFSAGSAVMTIIDDSKLKATVEVDEIDVQNLELGMKATITADSAPGELIEGEVTYIPMIGRYTNQGIGVMDVVVTIANPPAGLKPGFSFEGTINVETEQKMLLITQSAVTTSRGVSTVTKLLPDGTTQKIQIQVKYLGENLYQITGGDLKDGDTVVYSRSNSGLMGLVGRMAGAR